MQTALLMGLLMVVGGERTPVRDWWGPMPQTCYAPRFGCYPGNERFTHRYPAFHGSYYRKPYNYRNVFDYPWHAGLHEPTSHFSYNVSREEEEQDHNPQPMPEEVKTARDRENDSQEPKLFKPASLLKKKKSSVAR